MSAEDLPQPVGYQWLDTAHYRKRIPADATPEHWRALYTRAALDAVRAQERERCAQKLSVTRADVSLAAGEMTAQEWRTVSAVLRWMTSRIRDQG